MDDPLDSDRRRGLPSVQALVAAALRLLLKSGTDDGGQAGSGVEWTAPAIRPLVTYLARAELARRRGGKGDIGNPVDAVIADCRRLLGGNVRPVINATGVILHTNLGRSPLSELAISRVEDIARGYSNLEYDIEGGVRGARGDGVAGAFEALTGHPALVVNNNAAALLLALTALAKGRDALVSRGELIEIGGSFRLPEVMKLSGARLVEVGTTNRTRIDDYRTELADRTAVLLKVHTSNYKMVGFVESVPIEQLVELGRQRGLEVIEDLGSGSLLETTEIGLPGEPTVRGELEKGVGLVLFSGDKLLGGPQAGIVAGRADLIRRLERHPLYRALRPDKLTIAALEATLESYLRGAALTELPIWRMLSTTPEETRRRAETWANKVPDSGFCEVIELTSAPGGGSLAGEVLSGFGLAVRSPTGRPSAHRIAERLRHRRVPVISRLHEHRVILDPRTVLEHQDQEVSAALAEALKPHPRS